MDWKKYIEKHRMGRRETKKKNYATVNREVDQKVSLWTQMSPCLHSLFTIIQSYTLNERISAGWQLEMDSFQIASLSLCGFFFWCVTFTSWMTVWLKQETLERSEVTVVPFQCPSLQSLFFNALISLNGDYENIHMAEFRAATNVVASRRKRGRHVSVAHQE